MTPEERGKDLAIALGRTVVGALRRDQFSTLAWEQHVASWISLSTQAIRQAENEAIERVEKSLSQAENRYLRLADETGRNGYLVGALAIHFCGPAIRSLATKDP